MNLHNPVPPVIGAPASAVVAVKEEWFSTDINLVVNIMVMAVENSLDFFRPAQDRLGLGAGYGVAGDF